MLKCAVAGAEMALFVCHSAEHHFTEKTFLPKFADREKKGGGGKELKLGFWESLVGAQSLAHCGSVTLTFGNGEGEKRVKKKRKRKAYFSQLSLAIQTVLPLLTIL